MFRLLSVLLLSGTTFASVRNELAPVVDLAPTDSIAKVRPSGDAAIQIELVDSGSSRSQILSVSAGLRDRIIAAAKEEGVFEEMEPVPPPPAEKITPPTGMEDDQVRNRTMFNRGQGAMGAAVFYMTVGIGIQPNSSSATTGLILLGYPASYLGHFLYSRDKEWTDAHLAGTTYASSSMYLTTLLGVGALAGMDDNTGWRVAAFASAAAYPVGIHLGYKYGEKHRNEPGRVYLAQAMSNQGSVTGVLLPWALFSSQSRTESGITSLFRLSAATGIAGGIGGHVLGDRLFPEAPISGGLGLGISTLSNLGLASSVQLLLAMEPRTPGAIFGILLAGNTLGTGAGLKILPERRDTRERSIYISAGTGLGALGGIGLFFLTNPDEQSASTVYAYPLLGAWAGYGISTILTRNLIEATHGKTAASHPSRGPIGEFSFSPVVLPIRADGDTRWVWPGLTVSLR